MLFRIVSKIAAQHLVLNRKFNYLTVNLTNVSSEQRSIKTCVQFAFIRAFGGKLRSWERETFCVVAKLPFLNEVPQGFLLGELTEPSLTCILMTSSPGPHLPLLCLSRFFGSESVRSVVSGTRLL